MEEYGVQPLDSVLRDLNLLNSDLVDASTSQLSHKMVQKGRKGRRLTPNVQKKILNALNATGEGRRFVLKDLFNYANP